jgi:Kef-type K+ transport system membrane component KefB
MTVAIIITFCLLLLIAYLFDLTSSKTKIPSVILLLGLGWTLKHFSNYLGIQTPDFTDLLPILGTIGLILIVLEGSLELELDNSKFEKIKKSLLIALIPMMLAAFILGYLFSYYLKLDFKDCFLNAIPLCIISSAIAIPSASNLSKNIKEFVIYESSLSDILGVILFNFIVLNDTINLYSFLSFGYQIIIILVISFIATIFLAYLLQKINHHVKFVPIILLIILIYETTKIYHLPGLIFILLFGLFVGNIDQLKKYTWIEKLKPDLLKIEIKKFKEITYEGAFVIRVLFFLLFGFLIEINEIINTNTLLWAIIIVSILFSIRWITLKLTKTKVTPLFFLAPRGLITILLFLSIDSSHRINLVSKSLILQVILISAFVMMIGLMFTPKNNNTNI